MARKLYKLLLFQYWQKKAQASVFDLDIYQKALHFANQAHIDQKMPDGKSPYLLHLCEVSTELSLALQFTPNLDANIAIQCALLHDTIEDTQINKEDIEQNFGETVAAGVWALTKDAKLPKNEQMLDSLEKLLKQSIEVQMVKLADRIVNLQKPPEYWDKSKKIAYQIEARLILEKLGEANLYLAKRLEEKIDNYSQFIF